MNYSREKNSRKLTLSTILKFGKHKGKMVFDVLKEDKSYITWLIKKWEGEVCWKVKNIVK